MSTTIQDLDAIRARRAQEAQIAQQQQTQSVPQKPSASAQAGNAAGQIGGMAAGNYVANLASGANTANTANTAMQTGEAANQAWNAGADAATAADAGSATGYVAPVLGAITAAKGGYDTYQGMMNGGQGQRAGMTTAGAGIGTMLLPGVGTVAGAAIGNVAGYGLQGNGIKNDLALAALGPPGWAALGLKKAGVLSIGKDGDQLLRDQVRKVMQAQGGIDEAFNLSLADGSKFNIGLDGGGTIKTKSGKDINPYNIDAENPYAHQATLWAMPLAALLTGGDGKLKDDFSGYITNAAMSNANTLEGVRANILNFMASHKIDFATAKQGLDAQLAAGKIDQHNHDVYVGALGILESGNSKQYDNRSVQQVQQALAAPPVTLPAKIPAAGGTPLSTTPVPVTSAPPVPDARLTVPAATQQPSAFQKLIDEAKKRGGISTLPSYSTNGAAQEVMPTLTNGLRR